MQTILSRLQLYSLLLLVGAMTTACASDAIHAASGGEASEGATGFDATTQDPAIYDREYPPQILDMQFEVEGAKINAVLYQAQGSGPHPTVILLHGFPGFEKNLDLAQAMRRAGWNVLYFHYRGSWGSDGVFSFLHVVEDVAAVIEAVQEPAFVTRYRVDPKRLTLVGHSMGGFAALIGGAESAAIDCVASLAGANLGGFALAVTDSPEVRAGMEASLDSWSGPIRGASGANLIDEVLVNRARFDTSGRAALLAPKTILLVAGRLDDVTLVTIHHEPLVEALRAAGAASLNAKVFEEGDHSFSGQRIRLAKTLVGWLEDDCGSASRDLRSRSAP